MNYTIGIIDKLSLLFYSSDGGIYTDTKEDKLNHTKASCIRKQNAGENQKARSFQKKGKNPPAWRAPAPPSSALRAPRWAAPRYGMGEPSDRSPRGCVAAD